MNNFTVNLVYILLFSSNALSTILVASLTGVEWNNFTTTQKFVVICAITGNWTNTLLALLQKFVSAEKKGKTLVDADSNGTTIKTKQEIEIEKKD